MGKDQRRMERFIVIPFSNCRSDSSVDVVDSRQAKKPQGGGDGAAGSAGKPKGESLVARLLRGFKNLSQIFAVYEDDDDEGEEQREMVIGLPTDVKHVAHIGWDGSTNTTNSVRSWNRAAPPCAASTSSAAPTPPPPPQQSSTPAFSMRQFELAMAAQAAAGPATAASTSTASTTARQYCHS